MTRREFFRRTVGACVAAPIAAALPKPKDLPVTFWYRKEPVKPWTCSPPTITDSGKFNQAFLDSLDAMYTELARIHVEALEKWQRLFAGEQPWFEDSVGLDPMESKSESEL